MKLGIIKTSSFKNYDKLEQELKAIKSNTIITLGDDLFITKYCNENNIINKIYYCDWDKYGYRARLYRNIQLIKESDYILIFSDNDFIVQNGISLCKQLNKNTKIII